MKILQKIPGLIRKSLHSDLEQKATLQTRRFAVNSQFSELNQSSESFSRSGRTSTSNRRESLYAKTSAYSEQSEAILQPKTRLKRLPSVGRVVSINNITQLVVPNNQAMVASQKTTKVKILKTQMLDDVPVKTKKVSSRRKDKVARDRDEPKVVKKTKSDSLKKSRVKTESVSEHKVRTKKSSQKREKLSSEQILQTLDAVKRRQAKNKLFKIDLVTEIKPKKAKSSKNRHMVTPDIMTVTLSSAKPKKPKKVDGQGEATLKTRKIKTPSKRKTHLSPDQTTVKLQIKKDVSAMDISLEDSNCSAVTLKVKNPSKSSQKLFLEQLNASVSNNTPQKAYKHTTLKDSTVSKLIAQFENIAAGKAKVERSKDVNTHFKTIKNNLDEFKQRAKGEWRG